jgi:hypothetical protein
MKSKWMKKYMGNDDYIKQSAFSIRENENGKKIFKYQKFVLLTCLSFILAFVITENIVSISYSETQMIKRADLYFAEGNYETSYECLDNMVNITRRGSDGFAGGGSYRQLRTNEGKARFDFLTSIKYFTFGTSPIADIKRLDSLNTNYLSHEMQECFPRFYEALKELDSLHENAYALFGGYTDEYEKTVKEYQQKALESLKK